MKKYALQWLLKNFWKIFPNFSKWLLVQKKSPNKVSQHQKWMLQKFCNGFISCMKWIIFPYKWMAFFIHSWKMEKQSNPQIQSNILKRVLARNFKTVTFKAKLTFLTIFPSNGLILWKIIYFLKIIIFNVLLASC